MIKAKNRCIGITVTTIIAITTASFGEDSGL
jgi:hypothetical protein